ncbi:MAG: bifunctional DNA-formamidopyrimidine glycosylase/DNA-(apurinic or apyrimidinic site) lyase [Pseudomonadota bacterium]|nr:MAG: bifunctional DNA-formamidopyrimidine glycosylase/DNA-(apurinic or apyrimidinic site) lyase [Pseudomonadota bacterium]
MPELPEVEVTRRQIERVLVGRTVADVRTTAPSYFFLTPPRELRARLLGRRVTRLERHGKYLIGHLDDGSRLLLHLGMTGQLVAAPAEPTRPAPARRAGPRSERRAVAFVGDQHTHLVLSFREPGPRLCFRDVRKFGKVAWIPKGAVSERLDKLGPDALRVTGKELFDATRSRSVPIKTVLLDQSVLAGVGNIYADEALFVAKIRSTRPANALSQRESDALVAALRKVLRRSIATGGSTISDFVRPDGSDGGYQDHHLVYGRAGEPCPRCGTPIRRVVLGGRSTHYCPHCQK